MICRKCAIAGDLGLARNKHCDGRGCDCQHKPRGTYISPAATAARDAENAETEAEIDRRLATARSS